MGGGEGGQDKSFNFFQVLLEGSIAGGTAGVVVETALYPIDTIKTRLQAARGGSRIELKGLYSGLGGNLAGVLPASAIFVGVYEPTKRKLLETLPENLSAVAHFKNLEEKKGVRDELKTLEKMAAHNVQEKNNILEMYTKACEKLSKHLSKICTLHETFTAAKASEKEVKALKAKNSDQSLELKTLRIKADEWQSRVHETNDRLKEKEKERDQRIGENKRKMATLKSEIESERKSLEDREREVQEKIAKAVDLCSQSDAAEVAGQKECEKIYAAFDEVYEAAKVYMEGIECSIKEVDEATLAITGQKIGA